jgi:hypothetical protein
MWETASEAPKKVADGNRSPEIGYHFDSGSTESEWYRVMPDIGEDAESENRNWPDSPDMELMGGNLHLDDVETKEAIEKSLQGMRVLSELWDRRFSVLEEFFHERNKRRIHFFKDNETKKVELAEFLEQLKPVNEREEKVAEIVGRGSLVGMTILNSFPEPTPEEFENMSDEDQKLVRLVPLIRRTLETYSVLSAFHKKILKDEREMIESHDEGSMDLYMRRLGHFQAEFDAINRGHGEIGEVNEKFSMIQKKHKKSERLRHRGKLDVYAKESGVATITVTSVTHMMTSAVIGEAAASSPVYWKLTALTAGVALIINFVDFYFKFFSTATSKLKNIENRFKQTPNDALFESSDEDD